MLIRAVVFGALGAMLAGAAAAQDATMFDGQYVGELTLTKVKRGDCTPPPLGALYPLTISGGEVRFAYVPRFNTTLTGKVGKNGAFKASARARKGSVQMIGRVDGVHLAATISSPSCDYGFRTRE